MRLNVFRVFIAFYSSLIGIEQPSLRSGDSSVGIIFSTSEPLLLGGFTCLKIAASLNQDSRAFVVRKKGSESNVEILSNFNTRLKSEGTKVALPKPILIRPGCQTLFTMWLSKDFKVIL